MRPPRPRTGGGRHQAAAAAVCALAAWGACRRRRALAFAQPGQPRAAPRPWAEAPPAAGGRGSPGGGRGPPGGRERRGGPGAGPAVAELEDSTEAPPVTAFPWFDPHVYKRTLNWEQQGEEGAEQLRQVREARWPKEWPAPEAPAGPGPSDGGGDDDARPPPRRPPRGPPRSAAKAVVIASPGKFTAGRKQAAFGRMMSEWGKQISRPEFALFHSAKCLRLLPKSSGIRIEHPALQELLNKTRGFLAAGGDVGPEVALMLQAVAELTARVPQLRSELLPHLLPHVPAAIAAADMDDLAALAFAAASLRDEEPALWGQVAPALDALAGVARFLPAPTAARLAATLGRLQASEVETINVMDALQAQVARHAGELAPSDLAAAVWGFGNHDGLSDDMQAALRRVVVDDVPQWNIKFIDVDLTRIITVYAKLGVRNDVVLKAVARLVASDSVGLENLCSWAVAALTWSYDALAVDGDALGIFRGSLHRLAARRGLTAEQIEGSRLGLDGGGDEALAALWKADRNTRRGTRKLIPFEIPQQPSWRIHELQKDFGKRLELKMAEIYPLRLLPRSGETPEERRELRKDEQLLNMLGEGDGDRRELLGAGDDEADADGLLALLGADDDEPEAETEVDDDYDEDDELAALDVAGDEARP